MMASLVVIGAVLAMSGGAPGPWVLPLAGGVIGAVVGLAQQGTSDKAYRHHGQRHGYVYGSLTGAI